MTYAIPSPLTDLFSSPVAEKEVKATQNSKKNIGEHTLVHRCIREQETGATLKQLRRSRTSGLGYLSSSLGYNYKYHKMSKTLTMTSDFDL